MTDYTPLPDKAKLPAWLREAATELEKAHGVLDEAGMPDAADDGTPISLALRIAYALCRTCHEAKHE